MIDIEDSFQPMLNTALEDTLWAVNHKAIPTLALARHLSPEALQELGNYAYQQGAMMDAHSSMMDYLTGGH